MDSKSTSIVHSPRTLLCFLDLSLGCWYVLRDFSGGTDVDIKGPGYDRSDNPGNVRVKLLQL